MPTASTLLLIVGAVLALAAVVVGLRAMRRRGGAPAPHGVTGIADGAIVTVTGTVRVIGAPLIAPLSARSCVLYESYAHLYESSAERHRALAGQLADRKMVPFELDTAIGVFIVDDVVAELELLPRPVLPRRIEREVAFLRAHGHEPALAHLSGFEEVTIDPGALISVHGMAIVEPQPAEAPAADRAQPRIRLVAPGEQALTIGPPRRTVIAS